LNNLDAKYGRIRDPIPLYRTILVVDDVVNEEKGN